jgi:hypothetical protein
VLSLPIVGNKSFFTLLFLDGACLGCAVKQTVNPVCFQVPLV